jgi:adenosylcobinamide-GDP ribazoletransferase
VSENASLPPDGERIALPLSGWRAVVRDLAQMIRFYSRLPVPRLPIEQDAHALPDFGKAPRMVAVAGLIIGIPAASVLCLAGHLGLPDLLCAGLAVAVSVVTTGAFHEDGLADTFDGLAGGATPQRRLDIMKDSLIGAFGGSALVLGIGLRIAAIAGLLDEAGLGAAALLMLAGASLSRSLGLLPLFLLPPARPGGFSSSVGRPETKAFVTTITLSLVVLGAVGQAIPVFLIGLFGAFLLAIVPAGLVSWWALRTIHGQTGDIAGTAQQLSEIMFYTGILIALGWTNG